MPKIGPNIGHRSARVFALTEAEAIISARGTRFTNAKALFDALDQETGAR